MGLTLPMMWRWKFRKEFGKWFCLRCSRAQCGRYGEVLLASRLWQASRCCAKIHCSLIWALI